MPKIEEVAPLSGPSGTPRSTSAALWSSRAGASDLGVSDDGAPSWLGALGHFPGAPWLDARRALGACQVGSPGSAATPTSRSQKRAMNRHVRSSINEKRSSSAKGFLPALPPILCHWTTPPQPNPTLSPKSPKVVLAPHSANPNHRTRSHNSKPKLPLLPLQAPSPRTQQSIANESFLPFC